MADVRVAESEAGHEDALSVRRRVFVDGQGVDPDLEVDDHEDEATHFVAYEGGEPVGVARLREYDPGEYEGPASREYDEPVAKVERMAVIEAHRGEGVGRRVLEAVEAHAREQGFERARLHGQIRSAGFYETVGYERVSGTSEEAGIPHVAMEKAL